MGAKLRFRPILMTSFAFILGVFPLVVASGAGAGSRHSLGTAVCFGMLAATVIGVFMIPVLYVLVERLKEKLLGATAAPVTKVIEGAKA
jgi:HAE1 family hydrophobic/amphiphilic exporter-1/multidrug efflux pump